MSSSIPYVKGVNRRRQFKPKRVPPKPEEAAWLATYPHKTIQLHDGKRYPIAWARLERRWSGAGEVGAKLERLWTVVCCPLCGATHSYEAGWLQEDATKYLGMRMSRCPDPNPRECNPAPHVCILPFPGEAAKAGPKRKRKRRPWRSAWERR